MNQLINSFLDTDPKAMPVSSPSNLNLKELRVGTGNKSFTVGRDGVWAGAQKQSDAPFALSLEGDVIKRSEVSETTISGFDTGEEILHQVKISNTDGRIIFAVVERAVYVGSVDPVNRLPKGANIDEGAFQVIDEPFSLVDEVGVEVVDSQLVSQRYIRNISAGTVTLYVRSRVRYIIKPTSSVSVG